MLIADLAAQHPTTLFLVPVFQKTDADGAVILDSLPFVRKVLEVSADNGAEKLPAKTLGSDEVPRLFSDLFPMLPSGWLETISAFFGLHLAAQEPGRLFR